MTVGRDSLMLAATLLATALGVTFASSGAAAPSSGEATPKATAPQPFADLAPAEAQALIAARAGDPGFVLLDVRTPEEFAGGRLAGSVNLDIKAPDFAARLAQLDKARTYLVVCRRGHRSGMAMAMMKEASFTTVYNLDGGLLRWQAEGRPVQGSPVS